MILIQRVVVEGNSMLPVLEPGDRLLLVPVRRLQAGDIVAAPDPRPGGALVVKRVHAVDGERIDLRGDNPEASTDSRHFGPVPASSVVGRAVYRYHPPGRTGRIRR